MKTILVPVDFSAGAARAIRVACRMARLTKSRLVLLHVMEEPGGWETYGSAYDLMLEAVRSVEKIAAKKLDELGRACRRGGQPVRTIQQAGTPRQVIVATAAKLKASYIVMGSHGHGAVYDLFVGSTTQGVLRRAPCPVFVVPARSDGARAKAAQR